MTEKNGKTQQLEDENKQLQAENEKLKLESLKGKTKLNTSEVQPLVSVEKEKHTLGPVLGQSPKAGQLLQIHGLPLGKTADERTAEILAKVKKARAKDKAKKE